MDVSHVQTWLLIALFESETATPARAFVSSRRAIAMSQMLGLHRMDGSESSSGELCRLLHPPKDATEAEERRRTFWYAYYSDCWTSIGSGQGPSISEGQVCYRHSQRMPSTDHDCRSQLAYQLLNKPSRRIILNPCKISKTLRSMGFSHPPRQ